MGGLNQQRILIDWPLTPYTGWGSYGIQLAQALISRSIAQPIVSEPIQRSSNCDLHWNLWADQIEQKSEALIIANQNDSKVIRQTNCELTIEGLGNGFVAQKFSGNHRIGVTFFERSKLPEALIDHMRKFDLVVTGSTWNQQVAELSGLKNCLMVHQGIDISRFNAIPIPKLFDRSLVIFAGGKLEARKGQDIVIEAFKKFLAYCPEALLIACWTNIADIGLSTIEASPYIRGLPRTGKAKDIHPWLVEQGIPARNVVVPTAMANSQLPSLVKQADSAVFMSRCEGGTNLMAMEALACGLPTILSNNTGHRDLLDGDIPHAIGISKNIDVDESITRFYGYDHRSMWGESNPDTLVELWCQQLKNKQEWHYRGVKGAEQMKKYSWVASMDNLIQALVQRKLLSN